MSIVFKLESSGSVPTPKGRRISLYAESDSNLLKIKQNTGVTSSFQTGIANVNTGSGGVSIVHSNVMSGSTQNIIYYNITGSNGVSVSLTGSTIVVSAIIPPFVSSLSLRLNAVSRWGTRTPSINNSWQGICWSSQLGLFCAVANSGTNTRVMTSPNSITWTTRTSAANYSWRRITWSPELSLFVAVALNAANNDNIMTSPDGTTWTLRAANTTNTNWFDVCWSPELGLFCAVGYENTNLSGRVITSPDGITWTSRTAVNNQWYSVCWSPELSLFCAVALNGPTNQFMTSPDGITWTAITIIPTIQLTSITWSPELGLFCAIAGTNAMTSPDGTTWTQRTNNNSNVSGICWSPELKLFCAIGGNSDPMITVSADGITWISKSIPAALSWAGICWSPELGLFCGVAPSAGNGVVVNI